jgi:hypothetical protein
MPSFDSVNYSLRPSKIIQRRIVFDGIKKLQDHIGLKNPLYIGLGSIWFSDFILAHKILDVNDMVSIESDDIGYSRAKFNAPYATAMVKYGMFGEVLPHLCSDKSIANRPWILWLDYDNEFQESVADDVRKTLEKSPPNSILLVTVNAHEGSYGKTSDRIQRLKDIFGDVVPDEMEKSSCKGVKLQQTLAELALNFMKSIVENMARPGGFISAFQILYKDSSPMITIGGFLPDKTNMNNAENYISNPIWRQRCSPNGCIVAPHLTIKEAMILQSKLPSKQPITRETVQNLGFDLNEEQISIFQKYYKYYPSFAQIAG